MATIEERFEMIQRSVLEQAGEEESNSGGYGRKKWIPAFLADALWRRR